jgi:hypothetical protein
MSNLAHMDSATLSALIEELKARRVVVEQRLKEATEELARRYVDRSQREYAANRAAFKRWREQQRAGERA